MGEKQAKTEKKNKPSAKGPKNDKAKVLQLDVEKLRNELKQTEVHVKGADDKVLRAMAELENFKRRKEQEKEAFVKFANEKFVLELLPTMDSFDLAVTQIQQALPKELQSTLEGFLLIQKQLHTLLEKMGVKRIVSMDKTFDPTVHQAVSQEEVKGKASNVVVREMQAGYTLHERVIRPAMVVVSK